MHTSTDKDFAERPGHILARLRTAVIVLNLIAFAVLWWAITDRRSAAYERAQTSVQNLSLILANDITSVLDKADHAILTVIDGVGANGIDGASAEAAVGKTVAMELARRPDVNALRVTNALGDVVVGAGPPQVSRVNIADREYFMRLQSNPDAGLVISEPMVGRIGGKPGIVLARAFKDRVGGFGGVVYAMVLSDSFERLFSALDVGPNGAITLRMDNHALVARHSKEPVTPGQEGSREVSTALRERMAASPTEGVYVAPALLDGIERSNAYRKVAKYPFYIIVGLATGDLLQEWKRVTAIGLALFALYLVTTIVLYGLVRRSWKRHETAVATLARREAEFSRLSALVPGMISQFQAYSEKRNSMPYVSDAIRDIFELEPADVRENAAPMLQRIHPDDAERRREAIFESARTLKRYQCEYRVILPIKGERWLRSDSQPERQADGSIVWHGYIADITEQKRIEQALRESEAQLTGILESTADGILAVSRDGKVLRANARFARMWRIPQKILDDGDDPALLNCVLNQLSDPDSFLAKVQALYQSDAIDIDTLAFKDGRYFERVSSPLILNGATFGRVWSFRDITERKAAEAALRDSETRFRSLVELGSDWYWEQDEHFRFTRLSAGILHHAHLAPDEYIGKTRWEVDYEGMSEAVWQKHREQLERHAPFTDFEMNRRDINGELRILCSSGEPVFDAGGRFSGYRGVGSDITERRRAADKLRESEEKLRGIVDVANAGISIVDRSGKYVMFNNRWTELLGFDSEEMKRLTFRDVTHADDLQVAEARFLELIDGKVENYRIEKRYVRKDNAVIWTDLSVSALRDINNKVFNVVGMLVDITERKRLEVSLQRINEELELVVAERTRKLVEANAELQTITYTLAHDLRAPARLVAGFAGRLTDAYGTTIPAQGKHWLSLMTASANRQAQLVEDMLSYMKLGFKPVEREPIDMNALAVELTEVIVVDAARQGLIEWRIGQLPAVEGDRALIRVILTNLISNALKYSARAAHPAIEIGRLTRENDQPTAYYIRDNGVGFDQARASKLFGLFQRFHDPGEYPGTGIGLAIVKRLVEKHGGRVWAESTPGAGATFTFTLQAEASSDEHNPA